jgi:hypothetical protein
MLGFTDRQLYKIFLAIKQRHKKHWIVWFSRLEASRFWVSERRMQYFINALRKDKKLVKTWMVKWSNNPFKCNIYKLSKEFIDFLDTVREFVKKTFEYIQYTPDDVINYVSTIAKKKYWQWKFDINWIKYVVSDKWKWRGKILDTMNQKIVSLITIQNAR